MKKMCENCRYGQKVEIDEPCKIVCVLRSKLEKGRYLLVANDYTCRRHEFKEVNSDEQRD